jgi:hypothetical protein
MMADSLFHLSEMTIVAPYARDLPTPQEFRDLGHDLHQLTTPQIAPDASLEYLANTPVTAAYHWIYQPAEEQYEDLRAAYLASGTLPPHFASCALYLDTLIYDDVRLSPFLERIPILQRPLVDAYIDHFRKHQTVIRQCPQYAVAPVVAGVPAVVAPSLFEEDVTALFARARGLVPVDTAPPTASVVSPQEVQLWRRVAETSSPKKKTYAPAAPPPFLAPPPAMSPPRFVSSVTAEVLAAEATAAPPAPLAPSASLLEWFYSMNPLRSFGL